MIIVGTASAYKYLIYRKTWKYICKTNFKFDTSPYYNSGIAGALISKLDRKRKKGIRRKIGYSPKIAIISLPISTLLYCLSKMFRSELYTRRSFKFKNVEKTLNWYEKVTEENIIDEVYIHDWFESDNLGDLIQTIEILRSKGIKNIGYSGNLEGYIFLKKYIELNNVILPYNDQNLQQYKVVGVFSYFKSNKSLNKIPLHYDIIVSSKRIKNWITLNNLK